MSQATDRAERFVTHLEPMQGALEAFCRRALINGSDVEDVLQTSLALAYRDFHLYAEGTSFRAWMFRYVRFEVLNCNRRQRKKPGALSIAEPAIEAPPGELANDPAYDRLLQQPELILEKCEDAVAAAVRGLPDTEREILLLRAIGEFTYREIADVLEVPVGTVMGGLHRARMTLRRRLVESGRDRGWNSD